MHADAVWFELARSKSMRLVVADMIQRKLIGRAVKILGEIGHSMQVCSWRILGVIPTLELIEHHFS